MEQGDNQIVLGIGFPGMAESLNLEDGDIKDKLKSEFEITADVKEFEMDQAVTVPVQTFSRNLIWRIMRIYRIWKTVSMIFVMLPENW